MKTLNEERARMKRFQFLLACLIFLGPISAQEILSTDKIPEIVIKGSGDYNLLLIPCMSCRWNEWEEFMDRNLENYTMYAVTIPGYGGTPSPDLLKNTTGTPWRENALEGLSELMDEYELNDVIIVGHSWGSMVAIQLAARRKDVVKSVISIDGTIESTSWVKKSLSERLVQANSVVQNWEPKLKDAEEWSKFNGAVVGNTFGQTEMVRKEEMLTKIKLVSSFMATDRDVVLQYWRENTLIDLTSYLHQIHVPILDIQSFTGDNQARQKSDHLKLLSDAKAPDNVESVFMYDTKHFIMYHRPLTLDCYISDFINGYDLYDFAPAESEYFEESSMN